MPVPPSCEGTLSPTRALFGNGEVMDTSVMDASVDQTKARALLPGKRLRSASPLIKKAPSRGKGLIHRWKGKYGNGSERVNIRETSEWYEELR